MADWHTCKLGDLLQIKHGFAFLGEHFASAGTHVVLTPGNFLEEGGFKEKADKAKWYRGPIPDDYILKKGDLIVAMTEQGEGLLGSSALIPRSGFYLHNQRIGLVQIRDKTKTDPHFIYYLFNTKAVRQQIRGSASGTKIRHTAPSRIADVKVSIPVFPIQQRIAGILSTYDELIENSQRRIKILESMARALYRAWFVHFRFPGHEHYPRFASTLDEIPQGWEVKKLGETISAHIGGGWGKEVQDEDHTEPAWVIRGTDIPGARHSQIAGVPYRIHTASNLRSRKLAVGDIVFEVSGGSKGQPVGRSVLITPELLSSFGGDVICASFCKRIQPDLDGYGSELLYLSFLEGYESGEIEQYQVQSTGISNFKWTEYIANTDRVVPPKALREQFRGYIAPLLAQIASLGRKVENLRQTRDLLLPRLLSGKITLMED